jgi:hypothetical protein
MKLYGHISCADSAAVYLGIMLLALNYFSKIKFELSSVF